MKITAYAALSVMFIALCVETQGRPLMPVVKAIIWIGGLT